MRTDKICSIPNKFQVLWGLHTTFLPSHLPSLLPAFPDDNWLAARVTSFKIMTGLFLFNLLSAHCARIKVPSTNCLLVILESEMSVEDSIHDPPIPLDIHQPRKQMLTIATKIHFAYRKSLYMWASRQCAQKRQSCSEGHPAIVGVNFRF